MRSQRTLRLILALVAVLAAGWFERSRTTQGKDSGREPPSSSASTGVVDATTGAIDQAFEQRRSGVMVEFEAVVVRVLEDDLEGSRHQRFVVRIPSGRTVLIAHNIDLAPRVPVSPGDRVRVRGQYEWNERGGVVHWTHGDPRGRRAGGSISILDF